MAVRIVIVEDDIDDIVLLNEVFESTEFANAIQFFTNPEGIIPYLETLPEDQLPSIIISDLNMPKLTGLELLCMLKENKMFQHIPFLICTTSTSEKEKQKALSLGASDFMTKPIERKGYRQMIDVIRKALV